MTEGWPGCRVPQSIAATPKKLRLPRRRVSAVMEGAPRLQALVSAVGVDARPAARANVGEGLHGCSWSGRGYAVGVEAGTLAGAEGGGGVHGPPMGSMHDPVPARTWVLVRTGYLGVGGCREAGGSRPPPQVERRRRLATDEFVMEGGEVGCAVGCRGRPHTSRGGGKVPPPRFAKPPARAGAVADDPPPAVRSSSVSGGDTAANVRRKAPSRRGSAVRVDPRAFARGHAAVDAHRVLTVCRAGRSPCRLRRGFAFGSSSATSAVGVHGAAAVIAGADLRLGLHRVRSRCCWWMVIGSVDAA